MFKKPAFLFSFCIVLFLITRLFNLTLLPIFNDESTYIRYGLHQLKEPAHEPYSLRIGKEPLMPFLYAASGEATENKLLGARLVTVVFGLLTLIGLYVFTKQFTESSKILRFTQDDSNKAALFACLFYILAPYTLFFDRLALMDSAVSTIAIWSLYLTHRLLQKHQWETAFFLGLVIAAGLWIKFSALFYLLLPFVAVAIYSLKHQKETSEGTLAVKLLLPFIVAFCLFVPLLAHSFYAEHWVLLQQYAYPVFSIFSFPLMVWFSNISSVFQWFFFYMTPPLFVLGIVSLVILSVSEGSYSRKDSSPAKPAQNDRASVLLLLAWFVVPLIYEILFAKAYTARHALALTVPLFIAAGYGYVLLLKKQKTVAYTLFGVFALWSAVYAVSLYTDPQKFPSLFSGRAKQDMQSYVYGFSSGYGIQEAVDYLQTEAQKQPITIIIRNDHGNPEDAIVAYLQYKENIKIIPLNNPEAEIAAVVEHVQTPIYFVSRGGYYAGVDKYFVMRKEFKKPNDAEFVGVYRLEQQVP